MLIFVYMSERVIESETLADRVKGFAEVLARWDDRIVEILSLSDLSLQNGNAPSKLELVCQFDPEPHSWNTGYAWVFNLLIRNDEESASEQLGITTPIDLAFIREGYIHLPNGEIISRESDHTILWRKDGH